MYQIFYHWKYYKNGTWSRKKLENYLQIIPLFFEMFIAAKKVMGLLFWLQSSNRKYKSIYNKNEKFVALWWGKKRRRMSAFFLYDTMEQVLWVTINPASLRCNQWFIERIKKVWILISFLCCFTINYGSTNDWLLLHRDNNKPEISRATLVNIHINT